MKINGKTCFVHDIECFPNLFICLVKNTESGKIVCYEISSRKNDIFDLINLFIRHDIIHIGYNTHHYDSIILSYILMEYEEVLRYMPVWDIIKNIKSISDDIITSTDKSLKKFYKYKFANLFYSIDLMTMLFSATNRISLKMLQVTMQYDSVEEYSGRFDRFIPENEFDKAISYCENDINSTEVLLNMVKEKLDLRLMMTQRYGVDVMSLDDVNMGMEILKVQYSKKANILWKEFKDKRSTCKNIVLKDIIFEFIKFNNPILNNLLKDLKETILNIDDDSFEKTFILADKLFSFRRGGLHTIEKPNKYEYDPNYIIDLEDVTSMYPSIIINYGLYPSHLGIEFLETYTDIYKERLEAKKLKNKSIDFGCKKVLNGLSGNLDSPYSWVYDPKIAYTMRINGQLMSLMLIDMLLKLDIEIVQGNTDGICIRYHKSLIPEVNKICKEWESITKLSLESEIYDWWYQFSGNDYIAAHEGFVKTKDKSLIKKKGLFLTTIELDKGLPPKIIADCLYNYYAFDIPVDKTLYECNDIKRFLTSQRIKKEYSVEYAGEIVSNINRYFMSTNGYRLRKFKYNYLGEKEKYENICSSSGVTLMNKLENINPSKAHINYNWYRNEVYKIIYTLEDSKNQTLF